MRHAATTKLSWIGRCAFAALSAIVALAAAASEPESETPAAPETFSDRLEVIHVEVDLVVTDPKGRPVIDLDRSELELYRDGDRQEILTFSGPSRPATSEDRHAASRPRQLILYVDNLRLWPKRRNAMLRRMTAFVEERIGHGDRISVAAFDGGVELLAVDSRDAGRVQAALEALEARPSAIVKTAAEARRLRQDLEHGIGVAALQPRLERYVERLRVDVARSLAGLAATIDAVARPAHSTSILYLSDGIPAWPGDELSSTAIVGAATRLGIRVERREGPTTESTPTPSIQYLASRPRSLAAPMRNQDFEGATRYLEPLIRFANGRDVAFYPVRPSNFLHPSIVPPAGAHGRTDHVTPLARLARSTGGDFVPYARFEAALARLSRRLDSAYTLGFQIAADPEGASHALEVQVARKGLKAHYRRAYSADLQAAAPERDGLAGSAPRERAVAAGVRP